MEDFLTKILFGFLSVVGYILFLAFVLALPKQITKLVCHILPNKNTEEVYGKVELFVVLFVLIVGAIVSSFYW